MDANEETTHMDRVERTSWGNYLTRVEQEAILTAIRLSGKPGAALEVGCEGGRWISLLADLGWNVIGTDIRPKVLELCQRRVPRAKCILVSPTDQNIPVETQKVDLLLCIEVFSVIHANWFLDEAARVLRPGGIFVGVVTNSLSLRGAAKRVIGDSQPRKKRRHDYDEMIYRTSYRRWKRGMAERGLVVVHEEGLCWLPFSRSSNSFLVPLLVRMERFLGFRKLPNFSPWIAFVASKGKVEILVALLGILY